MAYDTAIAIGFGIIIFSFFFLSTKIDKKHGALQIFFMLVGLFFSLIALRLLERIADAGGQAAIGNVIEQAYGISVWIVLLVVVYVVVMFIYETWIKTVRGM